MKSVPVHISTEHAEQVGFIVWFRSKFPDTLIFAIPNGGKRTIGLARKLKDEGVVPGVPDLFIPAWKTFVEMKRTTRSVVSPDQERIITHLIHMGYTVIIGYGAKDASRKLLELRSKE